MTFTPIDRETWKRKEYFDHYFSQVPCTYSAVFSLDITSLRQRGEKLYPAMLYAITTIVNRHREFRTAINPQGQLGFYQQMHPCYTVFHKDDETFSNIWTSYAPEYRDFLANYQLDQQRYGSCKGMMGKPEPPENTFPVSMIPWASFTGFNLNLHPGSGHQPGTAAEEATGGRTRPAQDRMPRLRAASRPAPRPPSAAPRPSSHVGARP